MRLYWHGIEMYGFSVVLEIVVSLKAGDISKVKRIPRETSNSTFILPLFYQICCELILKSNLEITAGAFLRARA